MRNLALFIVGIFLGLSYGESESPSRQPDVACTLPFVAVGNRCLLFDVDVTVTQVEARQRCHSFNGELAAFLTATQFKDAVDYIYRNGYDGYDFWVDGSDAEHEGAFVTSTGQPVVMGTPFWLHTYDGSQPNNHLGDEDCMEMSQEFYYYLNDKKCTYERSPLCELSTSMAAEPVAPRVCPPFFAQVSDLCIAFVMWEEVTWEGAREVCHEMSGELAAITNIEQLREIYLYLHFKSIADHSFWIGGSDLEQEGNWKWTNGEPVNMGTPFWSAVTNLGPQDPQGGTAENCLYLDHEAGHHFYDNKCTEIMNPLCMI